MAVTGPAGEPLLLSWFGGPRPVIDVRTTAEVLLWLSLGTWMLPPESAQGVRDLIAALGAVTFIFSNLIGLRQTKPQRLLGYSSVGQMALMTTAALVPFSPSWAIIPGTVPGGVMITARSGTAGRLGTSG